jgi:hypothetical protein
MHQHHAVQADAHAELQELAQLLLEAVESDDKAVFDQLNIGALGSGAATADQIEELVWNWVHPRCSPRAQALLVAWRLGSEEALASWIESCFTQIAGILIEQGHQPGISWSRAPGPLLLLSSAALQAVERQLAEGLEPGTDPLALVRPWLLVSR